MTTTCVAAACQGGKIGGSGAAASEARDTSTVFNSEEVREGDNDFIVGLEDTGSPFWIHRGYCAFDTSAVSASLTSVSLWMANKSTDAAGLDEDVEIFVYRYDWQDYLTAASIRETNYDGAYGANASLVGTWIDTCTTTLCSFTWYQMDIATSFLNLSGMTRFSMVSRHDVDAHSSTSGTTILDIASYYAEDPFGSDTVDAPYLLVEAPAEGFAWIF